jgi:hypothetical protein
MAEDSEGKVLEAVATRETSIGWERWQLKGITALGWAVRAFWYRKQCCLHRAMT